MPRGAALDLDLRFDFDRKRKAVFFKFRKRVEKFGCEMEAGAIPPRYRPLDDENTLSLWLQISTDIYQ